MLPKFLIVFKITFGVIVAVFAVECVLTAIALSPIGKVFPVVRPELGQPNIDIGYAFSPNRTVLWTNENRALVRINSGGFRDQEVELEKSDGVFRVALSGDSIVEALQVENDQVFENLTELKFEQNEHSVEIMNFAMSGNGPLRQLVRLEKFAPPYKPDLTFLIITSSDFNSGELLDDSAAPAYKFNEDGQIVRSFGYQNRFSQRYIDTSWGQIGITLLHYSNLFRMIYFDIKGRTLREIFGLNLEKQEEVNIHKDECSVEKFRHLVNFWVDQPNTPNWRVTKRFFSELSLYASGKPTVIGFLIPVIPDQCEAQVDQRKQIVESITYVLDRHNIEFLDWNLKVLERLPPSRSMSDLYGFGLSFGTGHLNYYGHKVYSEVFFSTLSERIY